MQTSTPETDTPFVDATECGRQVWAALAHVVAELNIELADVTVVGVEPRLWPDASLGIAEPGIAYVQALTAGFVVRLQAGDRTIAVHTGPGPAAKCQGLSPARDFDEDSPVVASAMLNLAATAGLRFSDVKLVAVRIEDRATEPNQSFLAVTLEAAGRRYLWKGPETGPLAPQTEPTGQADG